MERLNKNCILRITTGKYNQKFHRKWRFFTPIENKRAKCCQQPWQTPISRCPHFSFKCVRNLGQLHFNAYKTRARQQSIVRYFSNFFLSKTSECALHVLWCSARSMPDEETRSIMCSSAAPACLPAAGGGGGGAAHDMVGRRGRRLHAHQGILYGRRAMKWLVYRGADSAAPLCRSHRLINKLYSMCV